MVNSRAKGARAERELANKLKEYGLQAHRTQQFCGKAGDADVSCVELASYHIECKMVEALNIHKAMTQALNDCKDKTPICVHRKNNKPWLVTMYLEDWLALAKPNLGPILAPTTDQTS
jgi:Holliday junction resolvase